MALLITKKGALDSQTQVIKFTSVFTKNSVDVLALEIWLLFFVNIQPSRDVSVKNLVWSSGKILIFSGDQDDHLRLSVMCQDFIY